MDVTYQALCTHLASLADEAGAINATVVDESGHLYGYGELFEPEELLQLGALLDDVIASAERPLHRGGHVHFARFDREPYAMAESFAGIYMLLLLFDVVVEDPSSIRAYVRRALPEIERLTVALPPDDPGNQRTAMRMRRT